MFHKLRGKSFYYWDDSKHNGASKSKSRKNKNGCCFNHIMGLPTKDGIEKPLFDYEREIYFALLRPGYLNSYPSTKQFNIKRDNVLSSEVSSLTWYYYLLII
ncbi:MAG TPA: hypothetical protein VJ250_05980 [Nitrososphaeraceae archaeon]|nr:hypothetical protein [Nitrososphaeraceae archaeon]